MAFGLNGARRVRIAIGLSNTAQLGCAVGGTTSLKREQWLVRFDNETIRAVLRSGVASKLRFSSAGCEVLEVNMSNVSVL